MAIVEALRAYFSGCPLLSGGVLHVDFLEPDAASYSLDLVPGSPIVKQYVDGSTARQVLFVIRSTMLYSPEIRSQLDNLAFFEDLQAWIEKQQALRLLPDLGAGRKCTGVSVTTYGYIFQEGTDYAAYQVQCKMNYLQEAIL